MDKRVEKTKKALHSAFILLRTNKSVREIKISELCKHADVNKTTFYAHYENIYDLENEVEETLLRRIIDSIPHDQDYSFENPSVFTREVMLAFARHKEELTLLFRDQDLSRLGVYLEQAMKFTIFNKHPHLKDNVRMNVLLTYCIHGAFHSQLSSTNLPMDTVLETVEAITQTLQPLMLSAALD